MAEFINLEEGLGRVRNNKKLYKRMLSLFLASDQFVALEDALAAGDFAHAADVAHGIKGMSGNLSLNAVYETSTELTEQLRKGAPDPAMLAAYREAYAGTIPVVERTAAELE